MKKEQHSQAEAADRLRRARAEARLEAPDRGAVRLKDFYAHMPSHRYIFAPTRETWPAVSVNARLSPIVVGIDENGDEEKIRASIWLDHHQAVEQLTWMPGEAMLIRDRLVAEGGFINRPGATIFNLYRPPICLPGDPGQAGPWLDHVRKVYPEDAPHIFRWLAHRVQRPFEKVNHALLLAGAPGIGKDTILHPVVHAIGPWNFVDVTPGQLLGRFNGYVKSVILRVNEARDLGEINRYTLYEHMKPLTAAPPEVLRCDEKNLREHAVPNVCGVIITSNYLTDGLYLPPDDRRHYVAWSPLSAGDLPPAHFESLYQWYEAGGHGHVAAWLREVNLADFNPKAPPPKTSAFWEVVDAERGAEESELADTIDRMTYNGQPQVITLQRVTDHATAELGNWLNDPKNRRQIPKRLEKVGYVRVPNPDAEDGKWKIGGRRQTVYGHRTLAPGKRVDLARDLAEARR